MSSLDWVQVWIALGVVSDDQQEHIQQNVVQHDQTAFSDFWSSV